MKSKRTRSLVSIASGQQSGLFDTVDIQLFRVHQEFALEETTPGDQAGIHSNPGLLVIFLTFDPSGTHNIDFHISIAVRAKGNT